MDYLVLIKTVFFFSIFLLVYSYAGYSILLRSFVALYKKKHTRSHTHLPKVSIVIPAHNEEKVIKQKIENCLSLDYPRHLLRIMVCSDCSTDRTAEIVREYTGGGIVRLIEYTQRSGKTGVLNKSIPQAEGEIVVLTDANTMLEKNAVSSMVSMYTSERIGAVLGHIKVVLPEGNNFSQEETVYRDFESNLKYDEGLFGGAIGAYGGLYSIRKDLYVPLPKNAYSNDDLLTPMRILQKGYKVLFDKDAVAIEDSAANISQEFNRRIRIGAGNFQSFFLLLNMLNPFLGSRFFFYMSHKVLRWFSPFILLILYISNFLLINQYPYNLLSYAQTAFYGMAFVGMIISTLSLYVPMLSSAFHFVLMNGALFCGFFRYIRGIKTAVWESTERTVLEL